MKLGEKYLKDASALPELKPFEGSIKVGYQSPSNIALIKYWGKKSGQIPQNPSLSFTLKNSKTITSIAANYLPEETNKIKTSFLFDGRPQPQFKKRLDHFLTTLIPYFPYLKQVNLHIESRNTFPHSSGIASSASAMSALALCLCKLENKLFQIPDQEEDFLLKASFIARLGSGSASRSVYPSFVVWGEHADIPFSNDEFAFPLMRTVHPVFQSLHDAILITSRKEKSVSSSMGHQTMEEHPFASLRYDQANINLQHLIPILAEGNWQQFASICEQEALSIHALMVSSQFGYTLLNDQTWQIINKIRAFREKENANICFTLDAGPNVHVIYPENERSRVKTFIMNSLLSHCANHECIDDRMGNGPELVK